LQGQENAGCDRAVAQIKKGCKQIMLDNLVPQAILEDASMLS
jgi:hypothetical protein